jgi:hypothetical protein
MSSGGMNTGFGGQSGGQGGMGGYGGQSPFGSNPMQTRPWMQQYGQPRTGGQMSTQDSVTPPTGPNPWGPGAPPDWYPRPYNNPNRSTSGAPINNFPGLQQPRTGGEMTVDSGMPKPAMAPNQPMTGGQDYAQAPSFAQQQPSYMQQAQAPQAPPQSWEQQNSQLLRPQQMQDPAIAAQAFAGGPTSKLSIRGSTSSSLRASIKSGPIRSARVARLTITCARSGTTNRSDRGG